MSVGQVYPDYQHDTFLTPMLESSSELITTTVIVVVDSIALFACFAAAVAGRHAVTPTYPLHSTFNLIPLILMMLAGFWMEGLYPAALLHPAEEIRRTFVSSTLVFLVMMSTTFLWRSAEEFSRAVLLLTWLAAPSSVLLARHLTRTLLSQKPWWGVPALVLGSDAVACRIVRTLSSGMRGVRIVGVLSDDLSGNWSKDLPPLCGSMAMAPRFAGSSKVRYAIVAMPSRSSAELKELIQRHCHGFARVLLIPDMPGLCSLGISPFDLNGEVGLEIPQKLFHRGASFVKRLSDLAIASALTLLLLPLLVLISLIIYLTSGSPIFFRHHRHGRNGTEFAALKFRTMLPNAEALLEQYLSRNPASLLEWQRDHKLKNDPRVTAFGRILRRLSLDELPQLFNVLLGQMSVVGPRPIVQSEIAKYGNGYDLYRRVLPGITGLWQVSGRNLTTYQERVTFDEYYVSNWSIWLDLYILMRTIRVVLTSEGAY